MSFDVRVGDRAAISIEASASQIATPFVFGTFLIWARGLPIGDPADSAALNSCRDWLAVLSKAHRIFPGSKSLPALELFRYLNGVVYGDLLGLEPSHISTKIDSPYEFFIDNVGMSSFEDYRVVLVDDGEGHERLIWWSQNDKQLFDASFTSGTLGALALEFVRAFDAAVAAHLAPDD